MYNMAGGENPDKQKISFARPETRQEMPALVVEKDGASYRLNSPMRPLTEAQRWAAQFEEKENAPVVSVCGLGNGIFLRELIKKMNGKAVFLVYEPCMPLFEYVKENFDISDILNNKRVLIITGNDARLTFREELVKRVDYFVLASHLVTFHPQYDKAFPDAYNAFFDEVTAHIERVNINKNTLKRFAGPMVVNTLKNLCVMDRIKSSSQLKSILPADVPVIIVSAGPSLDKNIGELRRAKGHSFIICVDTAIKYMLQKDIIPDATIVIEPEKPYVNYEDTRSHVIPLITDIEANPEIVLSHTGEKILFGCRGFVKQLLSRSGREENDIGSGGSVATAAFALCYQLGCKNIILIGQDLAYTGEATHAGNVQSAGINNEIGTTFVEDVNGGQVRTRGDWITYLKWFENAIGVIKDTDAGITVTDATEGGAKIHGAQLMTFSEAVDKYCSGVSYDFEERLGALPPMLSAEEYKEFMQYADESIAALPTIKRLSEEGAVLCGRVSREGNAHMQAQADADKKRISEIIRKCEGEPVYPLLNSYAVTDMAERLETLPEEERGDYYVQTRVAFETMAGAADKIAEIYKNR